METTASARPTVLLDAISSHPQAAFVTDRYGTVANPAVTCALRDLMHRLAELAFESDGRYPGWWRAIGEQP